MENTHFEPNNITCPCCGETFTEAQKRDLRAQLNVEVRVLEKIVDRVREKTRQDIATEQLAKRPKNLSIAIDYLNRRYGPQTVTFGMEQNHPRFFGKGMNFGRTG